MSDRLKTHIISLRLDETSLKYLDEAKKVLQANRGPGANQVSKTEAVKVLMQYGMEVFNAKYGNPLASQKKTKKS